MAWPRIYAVLCRTRTDEVNFDVAVFTNLSPENLHDGHGVGPAETLEEHLDVMAALFRRLDDPDIQRAVVNVDGAAHNRSNHTFNKKRNVWQAMVRLHGRAVLAADLPTCPAHQLRQ